MDITDYYHVDLAELNEADNPTMEDVETEIELFGTSLSSPQSINSRG